MNAKSSGALALLVAAGFAASLPAQEIFGLSSAPEDQPRLDPIHLSVDIPDPRQALRDLEAERQRALWAAMGMTRDGLADRAMIVPDVAGTLVDGYADVIRGAGESKPLSDHVFDTATGVVQAQLDAGSAGLERLRSSDANLLGAAAQGTEALALTAVQHPIRQARATVSAAGTYLDGSLEAGGELVGGIQRSGGAAIDGLSRMAASTQEDKSLWRHGTDLAGEALRTQNQVLYEGASGVIGAGARQVRNTYETAGAYVTGYFSGW